jgi:hypothetical protein
MSDFQPSNILVSVVWGRTRVALTKTLHYLDDSQ